MYDLRNEIKTFTSEYSVENHEQAKIKANNLIKKYPQKIELLKVIGIVFAQNKKIEDAIKIFKKILAIDPQSIDTIINIGNAYYELNQLKKALVYLEKAKSLNSRQSEVYFNLGLVYEKNENLIKAISNYKQSIKYNPNNPDALINLGNIYLQNKDYDSARKKFEKAVSLRPNNPNLYHNLGVVLTRLDKLEKAIEFYNQAKKLNSKNPLTYYNLGFLFTKKLKIKESIGNYKESIKLNPNNAKFYYNLALAETELGKYYDAIISYKSAINILNNYVSAKYNLSRLNLATENFIDGWHDFEERHHQDIVPQRVKNVLHLKQWKGVGFKGKIFVHGEQGIGDIILHSSMVFDLYKIQPNIYLTVDERLISLFKRSFKKINILGYDSNLDFNNTDCHITLASLGAFFRKSLSDFPNKPKAYILPNKDKVNYFNKILSQNKKIKIGLSWSTIGDRSSNRTIPLDNLSKFLILKDCDFINLQYGDSFEERKNFKEKFHKEIINFDNFNLTNDFESLSALIKSCDLVITISNVIAHLSGAIGKKTWVIVPLSTQWHWFHDRNNSLWYPNVKLFRQTQYGKWDNIIEKIYNEILNL